MAAKSRQSQDKEFASKVPESCPVRERLQNRFRPDWQLTNAGAGGSKDRVSNRWRDCGRRRLAEAHRYFRAREKLDLDVRYGTHAQRRISIEVGILRLSVHDLCPLVQGNA